MAGYNNIAVAPFAVAVVPWPSAAGQRAGRNSGTAIPPAVAGTGLALAGFASSEPSWCTKDSGHVVVAG